MRSLEGARIPELLSTRLIHTVSGIRWLEDRHRDVSPGLMARAGAAAADRAQQLARANGCVLVACGPGNNGGDGFVVARLLRQSGLEVLVLFTGGEAALPDDAAAALGAWRAAGGDTVGELDFSSLGAVSLVVDGLFGIGLQRPLEGRHAAMVERLNAVDAPRLALDIPSGLDARTGRVLGCAFRATETVSFIGLKPGLLTADGPDYCGQVVVADLGIPPTATSGCGQVLDRAMFRGYLQPRRANSHKGSYGDAVIIGGARGMIGAALLAGRAAMHVGAGRVFVGLVDTSVPAIDPVHPELMVRSAASLAQAPAALAVGPGLGRSAEAIGALRQALQGKSPLVLDADALNLIAEDEQLAEILRTRESPAVLTPHPAEAARLLGLATEEVQADRVAAAVALADRYQCPALVKGAGSVVAQIDGRWTINTTGHPGMASAGMGDALSGIVTGLIAQGWAAQDALPAAVHLHGAAADLLADDGVGPVGLRASETIVAARKLLNAWILASGEHPQQ
ncbi:MAG: NAD(P)H-hydrate dehydratase [Rhodocyclaceae bacterium]|nr:NAD(P)H-hydrate dehydratase [Rhodocyclaceae bacterium]